MWLYYSNRSFDNNAFHVGRIDLLAPLLNHKKIENWKQEGKGYSIGIRHFTWVSFILLPMQSPPPPLLILLYVFLVCFVVVGFFFCLKKACKLRLFPWTKYDLWQGVYPRVTELYQGNGVPFTHWAVLVVPSDLLRLCVLLQCTFFLKKLTLQKLLGRKVYFMEVSHFSQRGWGKEGLSILGKKQVERAGFFPCVPWKCVVLVIEKGMCCWQGHSRRAGEDPRQKSAQPLE